MLMKSPLSRIVLRAIALQCALNARRERRRERERELFMYTKQHFNSRKLNFVHYIFMLLRFLLPCITNFSFKLQQVALNVHFHTFISFPSSAELLRCAMKNMKTVPSSFFFFFLPSKFSCQNSVFIMLLLLEPDACSTPKHVICSRVEWRFFSGW